MVSITDSIVNIIIILAAVIVLATVISTVIIKNTAQDAAQDRNIFFEERTNAAVDAILTSTENSSGLKMSELMGMSMWTLQKNIQVGSASVDLTNETKVRFDRVFGVNNYYLRLEPVIQGVSVMFVLDSSSTVSEEREKINQTLAIIRERIKDIIDVTGDEKIITHIYLLPSEGDSDCDMFNDLSLPDTTCTQWDQDSLYRRINYEGWERPGFAGMSYENWAIQNYVARPIDFAESDWAAGVAAAALEYKQNPRLRVTTNINLIFPLSDELPTSSKSDSCFVQTDLWKFVLCSMCQDTVPVERSRRAIEQAIEFANNASSIVFPIYSVNCDYRELYYAGFNDFSTFDNPYENQFSGPPQSHTFTENDFPQDSWCHQDACGGCTIQGNPDNPEMCFHDNAFDELRYQMSWIANETNGTVFDVNNVESIPDQIVFAFQQTVAYYDFAIGFKDAQRDRFVYDKVVPLPNGALGRIELWVYTDPPRVCFEDEACETLEGCIGTRTCNEGNLSDACIKNDPECTGKPCVGPILCMAPDGCPGLKGCVVDQNGNNVTSDICEKIDPECTEQCFDECFSEGEMLCNESYPDSGVYIKSYCLENSHGCLQWEPAKLCNEPCQNERLCGEDPTCPLENCTGGDTCNQACSQFGAAGCYYDPDCPFQCTQNCLPDGMCNYWGCGVTHELDLHGCPPDPDCPICIRGIGDSCQAGTDPGCCAGSGEGDYWVWGERTYTYQGFDSCSAGTCFCPMTNQPPSFGRCCAQPTDCAVWEGGNVECVPQGTIVDGYISWDGGFICANNVMQRCIQSEDCVDDPTQQYCGPQTITVAGATYTCNHADGTWG